MKKENNLPNYVNIYSDIIKKKFPHKEKDCRKLLNKKHLSAQDILILNRIIFGITDKQSNAMNPKLRSYKKSDILQILDYQKKHNLNNIQLANHFHMSRNTISKWKKVFLV